MQPALVVAILAALLGTVVAQTTSPTASASTSPSASPCTQLLLNGTQPFDIFLLGSASASPSPSSSPSPAASSSPTASSSHTMNLTNTLIGGRAAVNGNAVLFNSLVGSTITCPTTSASPSPSSAASSANVTLLVTGNLNATNSRISCDQRSLQVGANVTQSVQFQSVGAQLLNKSRALCLSNLTVPANLTDGVLAISLSANAEQLTIISLNASDLSSLRLVSINASSNSSTKRFVIVNVLGTTSANASSNSSSSSSNSSAVSGLVLKNFGINLEGLNSSQLLWNFCDATDISIQFMRLTGSILSPQADLEMTNAGQEGSIVALSLQASFTTQNPAPFEGFFCLPNTNSTSSA